MSLYTPVTLCTVLKYYQVLLKRYLYTVFIPEEMDCLNIIISSQMQLPVSTKTKHSIKELIKIKQL